MSRTRKDRKPKRESNLEIYKGLRKPPTPPGRPHEERGFSKAKRKEINKIDDSEMD